MPLLAAALLACAAGSRRARGPHALRGRVQVVVERWCGGAAPDPTEPSSVSHPWQGQLLLRPGERNTDVPPLRTMATDDDGSFIARDLATGTYCLVRADKRDPPTPSRDVDPTCIARWWARCDAIVQVPGPAVRLELRKPCFGSCYRGPLPP